MARWVMVAGWPFDFCGRYLRATKGDPGDRGSVRCQVTRHLIFALLFIIVWPSRAAQCEAKIDADREVVSISGEITERDAKALEDSAAGLERNLSYAVILGWRPNVSVSLGPSSGGSANAAMRIGRVLRKLDASISMQGDCLSSCALIFIAGVIRDDFQGVMGLHRPYLTAAPPSHEAIDKSLPTMSQHIQRYVSEMGVTDAFYEQMVNTEPGDMKTFRGDKIYSLVPKRDAVYDETEVAYAARRFGITTGEMRDRMKDAERCREPILESDKKTYMAAEYSYQVCHAALLWGLSERVFVARYDEADKACALSASDFTELQSAAERTPHWKMWDTPVYVIQETCTRDIMLGRRAQ